MRREPRGPGWASSRGLSSSGLRMLGIVLIFIGLLVSSMAFFSEGVEGEGVVIIFPFIFGNMSGGAAAVFTIIFFALFIISSLLPWYMIQRRSGPREDFMAVRWEETLRSRDHDTMEYIITTELPGRLRRSIYIEEDVEAIHLRSTEDEAFLRSYTLPRGFEVDDIHYNYEGKYLVMKLMLKRSV